MGPSPEVAQRGHAARGVSGDEGPAAGAQDTGDLGRAEGGVAQVAEHVHRRSRVEGRVRAGQGAGVAHQAPPGSRRRAPPLPERSARRCAWPSKGASPPSRDGRADAPARRGGRSRVLRGQVGHGWGRIAPLGPPGGPPPVRRAPALRPAPRGVARARRRSHAASRGPRAARRQSGASTRCRSGDPRCRADLRRVPAGGGRSPAPPRDGPSAPRDHRPRVMAPRALSMRCFEGGEELSRDDEEVPRPDRAQDQEDQHALGARQLEGVPLAGDGVEGSGRGHGGTLHRQAIPRWEWRPATDAVGGRTEHRGRPC